MLDRKIRYCSLPEAVRDHFLWAARSIVVAGTHGKTTTTSLAGWLLAHGGLDPSVLVGGIAENFESSFRLGGGRDFVIEGDEYDSAFFDKTAKFLKYVPDIVVVGNVEFDHADIYPDLDAIRVAFRRLVNLIPRQGLLLVGADSEEAAALAGGARCRVETFGFADGADWQAHTRPGGRREHHLRPAPAGRGVRHLRGPAARRAQRAQRDRRRWRSARPSGSTRSRSRRGCAGSAACGGGSSTGGSAGGVDVYDDFAHHPTAIAETLKGVRSAFPDRRIWAVFEPRSATSCRRVFQADFARAFEEGGADEVIVAAVYRSTLPEAERLSPEGLVRDLKAAGVSARHVPAVPDIVETVRREAKPGDLVVVMSNGGFDDIHRKLLDALEARGVSDVTLRPAGDAAWFIELEDRLDEAVNDRAIAIGRAVDAARLPGVRDVVTGYRSVAVHVDPLRADAAGLEAALARVASEASAGPAEAAAVVRVPVCYGGELGPDLARGGGLRRLLRGRRRRAPLQPHVSGLHGGLRAGVSLHGHGRPADRDAAAREPAAAGAGPLGGDRRPADRHLSRRPLPAAGGSSGGRPCARSTPRARRPACSSPARACSSCRSAPPSSRAWRSRADGRPRRVEARHADDGAGPRPVGVPAERRAGGRAHGSRTRTVWPTVSSATPTTRRRSR